MKYFFHIIKNLCKRTFVKEPKDFLKLVFLFNISPNKIAFMKNMIPLKKAYVKAFNIHHQNQMNQVLLE